jgi:hypothetical protein
MCKPPSTVLYMYIHIKISRGNLSLWRQWKKLNIHAVADDYLKRICQLVLYEEVIKKCCWKEAQLTMGGNPARQ